MNGFTLALVGAATYRLVILLTEEEGPFGVAHAFRRLAERLPWELDALGVCGLCQTRKIPGGGLKLVYGDER